jgi:hypothetical protein
MNADMRNASLSYRHRTAPSGRITDWEPRADISDKETTRPEDKRCAGLFRYGQPLYWLWH